jgi:hypothetical protein
MLDMDGQIGLLEPYLTKKDYRLPLFPQTKNYEKIYINYFNNNYRHYFFIK